jgi:VanZ family protein
VGLLSFILSVGYGGFDEFHQSFTPGRTGHITDVLAVDLPGVMLAVLLYGFINGEGSALAC